MSTVQPVPDDVVSECAQVFQEQQRATLSLWRATVRMWRAAASKDRQFVADELALVMNVHPQTASALVCQALEAAELPALLAAWEAGELTDRHVRAASDELRVCLDEPADRVAVLDAVLDRCRVRRDWPTPGALRRLLRAAALSYDPAAARRREQAKTDGRQTSTYSLPDGQAGYALEGPAAQVIALSEAMHARAVTVSRTPGESRSLAQIEFDLAAELLTTGTLTGGVAPSIEVQVVMPLAVATGGGNGLGELVGYGPLGPDTCRELLAHASTLRRILTDPAGNVSAVGDAVRVRRLSPAAPTAGPAASADEPTGLPAEVASAFARMMSAPLSAPGLSSERYRPTNRAVRFVQTRDRTCRFPGCTTSATGTDIDHARPWPHGPTSPDNLHCLCRHHHRAKQSGLFTVTRTPDGTTTWTATRSGRTYRSRASELVNQG